MIRDSSIPDLEATSGPLLGTPLRYGLAETLYYSEPDLRERLGKAVAAERELRGANPEFVTFWSTPYNNGQTAASMAPFDMDSFFGDDLGGKSAAVKKKLRLLLEKGIVIY